jgi:predicted lipoprotein with Yx(FWY)xxD motif
MQAPIVTSRLRRASRGGAVLVAGAVLTVGALGATAPAAFGAQSSPKVQVAKIKQVGKVLVDAKGKALYTLTNAGQAVACSGACAAQWPPLRSTSGSATGTKGVKGLAVDQMLGQVTHDGLPLYRFAGDTKAGQVGGDGIQSFGGIWHVVAAGSAPVSSGGGNNSSGGGSGGGGYGY